MKKVKLFGQFLVESVVNEAASAKNYIAKFEKLAKQYNLKEVKPRKEDGVIVIKSYLGKPAGVKIEFNIYHQEDISPSSPDFADELEVFFATGNGGSGNDSIHDWLDKKTWKRYFDTSTDESVVNEAKTYKKGDKLKIKLKNGKEFDLTFDSYGRQKGMAFGKFKDGSGEYDTKPFSLDTIKESVNEAEKAEGDRSKLSADIEKALNDKATESGVPIGLLRLVMRRGLDAWNSSHREGVPQVAWGYARVNAFLEKGKGTWGKADADIAKEVRDGGNADKLPIKNPSEFNKKEREA